MVSRLFDAQQTVEFIRHEVLKGPGDSWRRFSATRIAAKAMSIHCLKNIILELHLEALNRLGDLMDLYQKIKRSIKLRKGRVFIRKDFSDFKASDAQLSRVLARLVSEGILVKIGQGVYAKAKPSVRTGKAIPIATVDELLPEVLDKLGIEYTLGSAAQEYADGVSTQIPMALRIRTSSRNRRKLGFGNRFVVYEDD